MVTGIGTVSAAQPANILPNVNGSTPHKEPVKSDRRSNKPIMEKRRRARINNCLNELKTLILDATKKDPARHSKLEKADILEKTVKHLQELQRQQAAMAQATDPKVINKFKAGFAECANEVSRFPGLEPALKRRLLQHLSNCINGVKSELQQHRNNTTPQPIQPMQVHVLPSPPSSPEQDQHMMQVPQTTQIQATVNGYFLPNGVQVIPTKLPNGNIALVLPQNVPQQQTQLPMLVPIPSRTSSTHSAASSSSYERISRDNAVSPAVLYAPPSPANSYEAMDIKPSVIRHASSSPEATHHQYQMHHDGHLQQHHHHHHHQQHSQDHYQQSQQHHYQLQQQQQSQYHVQPSYSPGPAPLSLVMKKNKNEEEQPWRPW